MGLAGPADLTAAATCAERSGLLVAVHGRPMRERQVGHAIFLRGGQPLATEDECAAAFRSDVLPGQPPSSSAFDSRANIQ